MGDWMDGNKGLGGIQKQIERQKAAKKDQEASKSPSVIAQHSLPKQNAQFVSCFKQQPQNLPTRQYSGFGGPVGSGIPNAYPICTNIPLDRAILKPFPEPLYDTEYYDSNCNLSDKEKMGLVFFQRPYSQTFAHSAGDWEKLKGSNHTNVNQSAMLDYPREFSLTGFSVILNSDVSPEDRAEVVENGHFMFIFSGRRPYFNAPLRTFPSALKNLDSVAEAVEMIHQRREPVVIGGKQVDLSQHHRSKWCLPFEIPGIDGECFRIKPDETFNAKIEFERPLKLSKPVKITTILDGYLWQPM